jgi:hypothetical protein
MTEEAREPLFGQYWAAKKAVVAYGLSEDFEDEPSVVATPNIPTSCTANATVGQPFNTYVKAVSQDYPSFIRVTADSGNTYIFVGHKKVPVKLSRILSATFVTSGVTVTLIASSRPGSMATQQSPTTEDEIVEDIIWRVGTTLSVEYRAKLTARLTELQAAVQEEEPDGQGVTAKSLQHFTELLKAYPKLKYPTISVTPERNIYASWKAGPDQLFSIHFLPDGNVRFVIFRPNDKHPSEAIRLSGAATLDVVMNIVEPHGVLNWATE